MKTRKIYIIIFVLLAVTFNSCKKEFLDQKPFDSLPFDEAITDEDEMDAAVNGMYSSLRSTGIYGENIPMMGDIMADNVYIAAFNSGRFIDFNTYVILVNNSEADGMWAASYSSILDANQVIDADIPGSENVNQLKGEAYTVRALLYFQLLQIFAAPYNPANTSAEGVPIVLHFDLNAQPSRNTIGEVYAQIISDLNTAIGLMTEEKNSEYVSEWVAKGLLAKVYQYMGDWSNARDMALDVVTNSGYQLVDSTGFLAYWANPTATEKSETLFEIAVDETGNNGFESLASMYSQDGYGDGLCSTELYDDYADGDVRKQLIYLGSHNGVPGKLIVNKYPNAPATTEYDDLKILRLAEVYLVLAEAYYNLGDEANALIYLNTIAEIRQPSFTGYTSTGTTLLDDITNERRKELAFEGNRLFDLNRLGLDVDRSSNFPPAAQLIPVGDYRRTMPIPQRELDANPNIEQNPGY